MNRFGEVRVQFSVGMVLRNQDLETIIWFHTNSHVRVTSTTNINFLVKWQLSRFINVVLETEFEGSGWALDHITFVNVQFIKNPHMRASSYIETPKLLKVKSAILNIQNDQDNKCFKWCILAHLYPVDGKNHPYRILHYKKIQDHNLKLGECPMKLNDIPKFEVNNEISVSVYGYSIEGLNESFYPLYNSKFKYSRHVELLYLESEKLDDNNRKKYHYTLIRNFTRLVTKAVGAKSNAIICRKCMVPFYTQETFDKHAYFCTNIQPQYVMPTDESNIIKFKNTTRSLRHPIVIHAHLEALLDKEDDKSHHIPHSTSFLVVDNDIKLNSELK